MKVKGEEDNTQQKALLIYKILPVTCAPTLTQLTCVFVLTYTLVPTQVTYVLVRTSLMQPSPEVTCLPRSRRPERYAAPAGELSYVSRHPERCAVPAGKPSFAQAYAPSQLAAFQ